MSFNVIAGTLFVIIYVYSIGLTSAVNFDDDDDDVEEPTIFNYNLYLQRPHSTRVDSKSKVETLGMVLKEKCDPGYVSKTGLQPCWPCPRGTYQEKAGQSSCTRCPAKADTATQASTNITQCELELSDSPQNSAPYDPFGGQEEEELLADECMGKPCLNGGTCVSGFFWFECNCADGYTGTFCQDEINECSVNPCLNEGTCIDRIADYSCLCPNGYTGKKCEVNINDCVGNPCLNGATCVDEVAGFSCSCPNGFQGSNCEIDINECSANPCLNGGTCADEVAAYKCTCPDGITGNDCEINEVNCASGPCKNQASCVDEVGTFTCQCMPGFTGPMCEIDIDECISNPCSASAKCEDLQGGYTCHCPSGFTGDDCSQEIDIFFQMDFPATASTTDYARVGMDKDLTAATVCFWMKTDDFNNRGTPFSYATTEGDNIFTLSDYDGFVFYVNGEKVTTTVRANDGQWKHVCVIWSSKRGSWKTYMDGIPMDSGRNLARGQVIKGGGQFVIGQEQDSLGGGFSSPESFIGQLSQLNVWSRELSLEDIKSLRLTCKKQLGDVIAWPDISGKFQGGVSYSTVVFCKECPEPASIDYGSVEKTGLFSGAVTTYSCSRGFNVAGRRERQCLITGEWEGTAPTCGRVQCNNYPGRIQNGWIQVPAFQRFTFGNRIRYLCNRGFKLVGDATRYCGEFGFWEGDVPICEQIKCTIPVLSENTLVTNPTPDNKFMPGEDVLFECTPGNQFYTDHSSVHCQRDGTWDRSLPTCDPQTCRAPPKIDNGVYENENQLEEFSVAFVVQYACNFGYMFSRNCLNPTGQISCLLYGLWESNLPECVLVQCGEPVTIADGQFENVGRNFLDQVRYTCKSGYELTHDNVLECYETGEWSPAPPECIPVRCGRPEDILHGSFEGNMFSYNGFVIYKCDLGYVLVGDAERVCQADATWRSEDVPVCNPVSCGKPESIEFGSIIGQDYTLNNVVRYVCDVGYKLVGSEERICRETGRWQNNAPSCRKVECIYPAAVPNAFFADTLFFFGDTVTYQCEEGYYLEGERTLICLSNRVWSFAAPACLKIECMSPSSLLNGIYLNPEGLDKFEIGYRIQYQCSIGYEISLNSLNPSGQIECLSTGQWWEANLPECLLVVCRQPLPIANGIFTADVLTYLSKAVYRCDEGYEFEDNNELTCGANGEWAGQIPVCNPVECLPPDLVHNVRVSYIDLKLGSVVRYMCHDGYNIMGLEFRRCLANLSWSGEEPVCQPISCGEPEELTNGFKQSNGHDFQSTVTYECNIGYILKGDRTRTCSKDKTWSGHLPVCDIVQCDKPSRITSNGRMEGDVYSYESVIEYVCDPGYYIYGQSNRRTCLSTGHWDSPIPVCIAVECPRLSVENGVTSVVTLAEVLESAGSPRLSRIEERLKVIEVRQDSEIKFRREDTEILFAKLDSVERLINASGQFEDQNIETKFDSADVTETIVDTNEVSGKIANLDGEVKSLFKAFKDEKELNARIRKHLPIIEHQMARCGMDTTNTFNYLVNISNEIDETNVFLNDVRQIIEKNGMKFTRNDENVAQLIVKVDQAILLLSSKEKRAESCLELYNNGHRISGVYDVYPGNRPSPIRVYCDQDTDGGGWTVFQRREDGSEDFFRGWLDYKFGFGNLEGEFWLGNEYLSSLTGKCCHELRIDLEDFEGNRKFATYSNFKVGAQSEQYVLSVSGYSGDATDSFSGQSSYKFSTKDRDNDVYDKNCAQDFKGAWWYSKCHASNLNGYYYHGKHDSFADGINWRTWLGYHYSLQSVEMKFRPTV